MFVHIDALKTTVPFNLYESFWGLHIFLVDKEDKSG